MREKKQIGLLDLFAVILIVLGIAGLGLRIVASRGGDTEEDARTVVASVYAIPTSVADCIAVGEWLYTEDGTAYGYVEAKETAPARIDLTDAGVTYTGEWDGDARVDLTLSIRITGRVGDGVFLRGGRYAILVGDRATLHAQRLCATFLIRSVKVG